MEEGLNLPRKKPCTLLDCRGKEADVRGKSRFAVVQRKKTMTSEYLNFKKSSIGDRVSCQQLGLEGSLCGLVDWFTSPMTFWVMGRWTARALLFLEKWIRPNPILLPLLMKARTKRASLPSTQKNLGVLCGLC